MKITPKKVLGFTSRLIQLASVAYAIVLWPPVIFIMLAAAATTIPVSGYLRKRAEKKAYPVSSTTPLTEGEISLVKSVFGPKTRLKKVKKYFSPQVKKTAKDSTILAQVFGRKALKFYGNDNNTNDYSQTDNADLRSLFMHEMTHIIQNKKPLRDFFNSMCRTKQYEYTLSEKSRFQRFGVEQQASIIEDYTRLFLHPDGYRPQNQYLPAAGDSKKQDIDLLKKVVEDRFPEARKSRQALDTQKPQNTLASHILSKASFKEMSLDLQLDVLDLYYSFLRNANAAFLAAPTGEVEKKTVALVEEAYPKCRETRARWLKQEQELDALKEKKRLMEEKLKPGSAVPPPQAARMG